jgi:DNA-binding MarR family transcriptional regulator
LSDAENFGFSDEITIFDRNRRHQIEDILRGRWLEDFAAKLLPNGEIHKSPGTRGLYGPRHDWVASHDSFGKITIRLITQTRGRWDISKHPSARWTSSHSPILLVQVVNDLKLPEALNWAADFLDRPDLVHEPLAITPETRLLGLLIKHQVAAHKLPLKPEHFRGKDLRDVFNELVGFGQKGSWMDMEKVRQYAADGGKYDQLLVWLVDVAAAPDPENLLIEPRDEIATLVERIRGRNVPELPPPPAPSPPTQPEEKPVTTSPASAKELPPPPATKTAPPSAKQPRETRISDDAELIEGARSMEWISKAGKTQGLTHLEAHVLLFIAAHISGGKRGTGAAFPSVATIAEGVGADRRNVRRAVDRLVELSLIAVAPGGGRRKSNTYRTALPRHLATTGKSEAKSEAGAKSDAPPKERTPPKAKTPAHPLPPDWMPSPEAQQRAIEELGSVERATAELAKFRDYYLAKGVEHRDWDATWRNWVRRAIEYVGGAARPYGQTR